jgi:hypothetical protein
MKKNIKKIKKLNKEEKEAKKLVSDPKMIALALYNLNKAAKRRRDAANSFFKKNMEGLALYHRVIMKEYYDLKDRVLRKARADRLASIIGYHRQTYERPKRVLYCSECGNIVNGIIQHQNFCGGEPQWKTLGTEKVDQWLEVYDFCGFIFHIPCLKPYQQDLRGAEVKNLKMWTSSSTSKQKTLSVRLAKKILEIYLDYEKN